MKKSHSRSRKRKLPTIRPLTSSLVHEPLEARRLLAADFAIDDISTPPPPTMLSGFKWNDVDADGNRDSNESGLGGVAIYVDSNLNGQLDDGEPRTRTSRDDPATEVDESGFYSIELFKAGLYIVREVVPLGFEQTFPSNGAYLVSVQDGQQLDSLDFGNHRISNSSIHGLKWLDQNGNGVRDAREPGVPGVTNLR